MEANSSPSREKDNADVRGTSQGRGSRLRVSDPPSDRPVLVYDGDCAFCRRWVERGRRWLGDRLDYVASREGAPRYPEIPAEAYAAGVQFIDLDGRVWGNAAGALHALALRPGWCWVVGAYERVPGVGRLAEAVYRLVATNRGRLGGGKGPSCGCSGDDSRP